MALCPQCPPKDELLGAGEGITIGGGDGAGGGAGTGTESGAGVEAGGGGGAVSGELPQLQLAPIAAAVAYFIGGLDKLCMLCISPQ